MDWIRLESSAYWITFTATFLLVAMWESKHPERDWRIPAGRRWTIHGLLTLLAAVLRLAIFRLSPVALALATQRTSWSMATLPWWVSVPATVLLLDLSKYATHRLFHAIPWLWRVHRVHHSDPDFDVSTGLRFHPVEPFLPLLADLALIALLGLPVEGVIVAQVLACAINFLEHANANLPPAWERSLRGTFITPLSHRIHHSVEMADQHSNFGELFSWWDRMLGTFRVGTNSGKLEVGLRGYETSMGLPEMLLQPFQASREPQTKTTEAA